MKRLCVRCLDAYADLGEIVCIMCHYEAGRLQKSTQYVPPVIRKHRTHQRIGLVRLLAFFEDLRNGEVAL